MWTLHPARIVRPRDRGHQGVNDGRDAAAPAGGRAGWRLHGGSAPGSKLGRAGGCPRRAARPIHPSTHQPTTNERTNERAGRPSVIATAHKQGTRVRNAATHPAVHKVSGPRRGVQTDGVLVQRWVDSAGPGRSPGRFFYGFWAIFKQKWHTTPPTAPRWKALIETCQKTTRKGMSAMQTEGQGVG